MTRVKVDPDATVASKSDATQKTNVRIKKEADTEENTKTAEVGISKLVFFLSLFC